MGECLLYKEGRLFGGLYGNCLLVKPTAAVHAFLHEQGRRAPEEVALSRSEKDASDTGLR